MLGEQSTFPPWGRTAIPSPKRGPPALAEGKTSLSRKGRAEGGQRDVLGVRAFAAEHLAADGTSALPTDYEIYGS